MGIPVAPASIAATPMGLSDIDEDEPVRPPTKGTTAAIGKPAASVTVVQPPVPPSPALVVTRGKVVVAQPDHSSVNGENVPVLAGKTITSSPGTAVVSSSPLAVGSPGSAKQPSVLDDLFSDFNVGGQSSNASANVSSAAWPPFHPPATTTMTANATAAVTSPSSVLDDLFSSPAPAESLTSSAAGPSPEAVMIYVDGGKESHDATNLFDLSKPVKKDSYTNAESFLEGFERQGKKGGSQAGSDPNSLANLTRNKDDNKVRARLLALMNYYDVLGVATTASEEEIRRSYKRKALELHPDRVGRNQTQEEAELFKMITKAHEVLIDTASRRAYDEELQHGNQFQTSGDASWWTHLKSPS